MRTLNNRNGRRDRRRDDRRRKDDKYNTIKVGGNGTETIKLEIPRDMYEDMDELAYDDGTAVEDIVARLIECYTYGDIDVDIDNKDRIFFREDAPRHGGGPVRRT